MTYGSKRTTRGRWVAILLAVGVCGLFAYLDRTAIEHFFRSIDDVPPDDVFVVAVKAPANMATHNLALGIDPFETDSESGWQDYRSRPAPSAFAILEPYAGVRLLAPQTSDTPGTLLTNVNNLDSKPISRDESFDLPPSTSRFVSAVKNAAESSITSHDAVPFENETSSNGPTAFGFALPYPKQLMADLLTVRRMAEEVSDTNVIGWCDEIENSFSGLRECMTNEVSVRLDDLMSFALNSLDATVATIDVSDIDTLRLRIGHSIVRRVSVWKAVWACLSERNVALPSRSSEVARLATSLERIQTTLQATGDAAGWETYLMLPVLQRIVAGDSEAVALACHEAQVVLTRITSGNVNETQRKFLDSAEVHDLAESLHPLAIAPVDYYRLLVDLEMVEESPEHRSRRTLVDTIQSLRFADDPKQVSVSRAIETYYRNSNVRIAVSKHFANRFMPTNKRIERPVRQTVLGADTRGNSSVDTTLRLNFIPDPHAWNIELDLLGKIQSQTHSSRGPAIFFNSSNSNVTTKRNIRIDLQGIHVNGGKATVESQDALRGVETAYDGLPFIGEMVRYMASQEFKEKRGPARKITQRSIASQTDAEFDKQLQTRIGQAEKTFEQRLLGPLRNLDLNPMVSDLQTTEDRLIARYRLASDNALAANTPRPQAPSDSLLSIQVHQSAINNGFSQLGLSEKEWTLLELSQHLARQFGQEPVTELPAEVPSDVRVKFSGEMPIVVEFIEGRLWLTLNVALLTQPGRIELADFSIRTSYAPGVDGLEAELIREGAISVDGDRISARERMPLRLIFGKVFTARSNIPLIQAEILRDPRARGLAVSQIVLEQGWMAIAISEETSSHVALLRERQVVR